MARRKREGIMPDDIPPERNRVECDGPAMVDSREVSMSIADPIPVSPDADGVFRVGGTRVTIDTVIEAFQEGMTPEGIAEQYPSLSLADVYSAIAYYLYHRDEVEAYLKTRRAHAAEVRRENEARFDPAGVRERLLARRKG
jgi:uncharacterized protein (DUF433 family)